MAKEQNLSLNSQKISGACGRLMCCLRYESDFYEEEIKKMPKIQSKVIVPNGVVGTVTDINPLTGTVKVRLYSGEDEEYKYFKKDELIPEGTESLDNTDDNVTEE